MKYSSHAYMEVSSTLILKVGEKFYKIVYHDNEFCSMEMLYRGIKIKDSTFPFTLEIKDNMNYINV